MEQGVPGERPHIFGPLSGSWPFVAPPSDLFVLAHPSVPVRFGLLDWRIRSYPVMQLVKRGLAKQVNQLGFGQLESTAKKIMIHEPASRLVKPLVEATCLIPQR